jgi:hypothetical protein
LLGEVCDSDLKKRRSSRIYWFSFIFTK